MTQSKSKIFMFPSQDSGKSKLKIFIAQLWRGA